MSAALCIVHFNDVYNIGPFAHEPVGGASRFKTRIESFSDDNPLVLFSGDAFNPSLLSTVTHGKHMVPVLNKLKVRASVFGNHDFDFGVETLERLASQCDFPWIISNATHTATKEPLAKGKRILMLEHEGKKIGLMGLIEREWLATLSTIDEDDVEYTDFIQVARELNAELRALGADIVVALTHMRLPNDELLCTQVPEIDLVLGGHDHFYACKQFENGPLLCKSGTDFKELTKIKVVFDDDDNTKKPVMSWERFEITSSIDEDVEVKAVVEEYMASLKAKMDVEIGVTAVELDSQFSSVRTRETNIGNFVTDVMRRSLNTDIALLNSGTLRADTVFPVGPILMRDLLRLLPMLDETIVLGLSGSQLLAALENGVSQWPKQEGRFPQVSGVKFSFDGSKPAGSRVVAGSVYVGDEPLQLQGKEYTVATKAYLASGKDGYDVFTHAHVIKDAENCIVLPSIMVNHFKMLQICQRFADAACHHSLTRRAIAKFKHHTLCHHNQFHITPAVEGRIVCVGQSAIGAAKTITLLHFNDAYEMLGRKKEPVGGAARFRTLVKSFAAEDPVVLFSGDCFNPSSLSTVTRGKHMVPIMNALEVKAAVFGNHDFDFGVETLEKLSSQCAFPWLLSNATHTATKQALANGRTKLILEHQGHKIGLMGLIEREWLAALSTIDIDDVEYTDFIQVARELNAELRALGADIVVALTHMRLPNDELLCTQVPEIDLVLGGHDHFYACKQFENGPLLCKSGTDFKELTKIKVVFDKNGHRPGISYERHEVTSSIDPNAAVDAVVKSFTASLKAKMDVEIAYTKVDLDCQFSSVRTRETNIGNLCADLLRVATRSDVALINAGTLRLDTVLAAGVLLMKDLTQLLPMMDSTIVLGLSGSQLLAALENGVSQWPKQEGRFPQVSGVKFSFDGSKPAGSRVVAGSVYVGDEPLQLQGKEYTVATIAFLAQGKDGYESFKEGRVVVASEECPMLPTILRNHFKMLQVCKRFSAEPERGRTPLRHAVAKFKSSVWREDSEHEYALYPQVEDRIVSLA